MQARDITDNPTDFRLWNQMAEIIIEHLGFDSEMTIWEGLIESFRRSGNYDKFVWEIPSSHRDAQRLITLNWDSLLVQAKLDELVSQPLFENTPEFRDQDAVPSIAFDMWVTPRGYLVQVTVARESARVSRKLEGTLVKRIPLYEAKLSEFTAAPMVASRFREWSASVGRYGDSVSDDGFGDGELYSAAKSGCQFGAN